MQGRAAKGYAVFLRSWFAYAYVDRVRATCRHSAAQVRFQVGTYETGGYAMHTNEIRGPDRKRPPGAALLSAQSPSVLAGDSEEALPVVPAVLVRVRVR